MMSRWLKSLVSLFKSSFQRKCRDIDEQQGHSKERGKEDATIDVDDKMLEVEEPDIGVHVHLRHELHNRSIKEITKYLTDHIIACAQPGMTQEERHKKGLVLQNVMEEIKSQHALAALNCLPKVGEEGGTPLFLAAKLNASFAAELMLNHGASMVRCAPGTSSMTPLEVADIHGSTSVMKLFLNRIAALEEAEKKRTAIFLDMKSPPKRRRLHGTGI